MSLADAMTSLEKTALRVKWERDAAFDLLGEIAEFLEDQLDVVDGSYGEQKPNRAMSLHTQIELLIGKLP